MNYWALGLFCLLGLVGCQRAAPPPESSSQAAQVRYVQGQPVLMVPESLVGRLATTTVGEASLSIPVTTPARVEANENRVYRVAPLAAGRILSEDVVLGQTVRAGQRLAVMHNPEAIRLQGEYIHQLHQNAIDTRKAESLLRLAQTTEARERELFQAGISARKDWQQAEGQRQVAESELAGLREHRHHITTEARSLLGAYGLSSRNLARSEQISATSPLTTPRAGVVVKKHVTVGDSLQPGEVAYEVDDLRSVWLWVTLYPAQVPLVRAGMPVAFQTDSRPGETFSGTLDWVPPIGNAEAQTFEARAVIANPSGRLRPGMAGFARLTAPPTTRTPVLPAEAVQRLSQQAVVFVPQRAGRYAVRRVTVGPATPAGAPVLQGLRPGDPVVTTGSFTLKATLLKALSRDEGE